MEAKTLKDFDTVKRIKSPEVRDALIEALYKQNKLYYYTDCQKDGFYIVAYNK